MKFNIKHADTYVGIGTIIAIAALIALVFSLGTQQNWFTAKNNYYSRFETAANLSKGMNLLYRGFPIGKITNISLNAARTVDVSFYVLNTYADLVRQDSIIQLIASPIGLGTQLLFYPGNSDELLPPESFIARFDSAEGRRLVTSGLVTLPSVTDPVNAILSQATELLSRMNTTVEEINLALKGTDYTPLGKSVSNIAIITQEIATLLLKDGSVNKLFTDQSLYNSADTLLGSVNSSLKTIDSITTEIKGQMPQIEILLIEAQLALRQTQAVLEGVKNNPLIKDGVPKPNDATITTPLFRSKDF